MRAGGDRELRAALVAASHALHARGWVANHDGNLTARLGEGRLLATPTAVSKARVTEASLVVVDGKGKPIGPGKPFGELGLHLTVYARRSDVHAIVHAHPPHATAIGASGARLLERPFIAEAVVSLGASIPTVPFAPPGPAACAALAPHVEAVDAVLLANHGALAWGADVEQAMLRLELVEHLARIALLAQAAGGVQPLPEAALPALLEARARAGLGQAAERAAAGGGGPPRVSTGSAASGPAVVVACAPAPHADVNVVAPGGRAPAAPAHDEIARVVHEELLRALGRTR